MLEPMVKQKTNEIQTFLKKFCGVFHGEEFKHWIDFQLLDQARLLTVRFLTATRSERRIDF